MPNGKRSVMKMLRQTGRTTRMLQDVLKAIECRNVHNEPIYPVVIFSDISQVKHFKSQPEYVRIHMLTFEQACHEGYIDPITLKTKPRSNEVIWVDHFVIEVQFSYLFELFHRYDKF